MKTTETFYPEMKQNASQAAEIIVETLYKMYKIICLNGIELKETKGVEFKYTKNGNKVYYCTPAQTKKLESKYNVSYSILLD